VDLTRRSPACASPSPKVRSGASPRTVSSRVRGRPVQRLRAVFLAAVLRPFLAGALAPRRLGAAFLGAAFLGAASALPTGMPRNFHASGAKP